MIYLSLYNPKPSSVYYWDVYMIFYICTPAIHIRNIPTCRLPKFHFKKIMSLFVIVVLNKRICQCKSGTESVICRAFQHWCNRECWVDRKKMKHSNADRNQALTDRANHWKIGWKISDPKCMSLRPIGRHALRINLGSDSHQPSKFLPISY